MTKKKHYRDLTIDEPMPADMKKEVEAYIADMTLEQREAMLESSWFTNPGGHMRMRILKNVERKGLVKFLDGGKMLFVNPDAHPDMPPEMQRGLKQLIELVQAVGGCLDDPYYPERTRADYVVLQ